MKINSYKTKFYYPPLWFRRFLFFSNNLYNFLFNRFPLADKHSLLSCDPLFIISSGRAGTTLLRSMLVANGEIAIPPESQVIHNAVIKFPSFYSKGRSAMIRNVVSEFERCENFRLWELSLQESVDNLEKLPSSELSLARIIDEIFLTYARDKFPQAKLWGDQSPIYTFALPYIGKVFPRARYIHLLRDGRDVISSIVKRRGPEYLPEGTYRWKESIKRIEKFEKMIDPSQIIEIRYESLVSDPETTLKDVCNFVDIAYSDKMLEFYRLPTTVENKYYSFHKNLSKPVFASSIGAWKDRLEKDQVSYIMNRISPELEKYGYLKEDLA